MAFTCERVDDSEDPKHGAIHIAVKDDVDRPNIAWHRGRV